MGELSIYLELEEPDSAERALEGVESFITESAIEHLRTALDVWSEADPAFKPARQAREKLAELST